MVGYLIKCGGNVHIIIGGMRLSTWGRVTIEALNLDIDRHLYPGKVNKRIKE
jgi:hypothetical protein